MKMRLVSCSLLSALCLLLTVTLPAAAQQLLYENGPINGTSDAWTINFGFAVSDTFTISGGTSTVQGMQFGLWILAGDVMESAEVSITAEEFGGTTYFDQNVNFTATGCVANQYGYDVCQENGSFSGPTLNNGTYWVTLQNAVVNTGDPVYWDENSGIGCHSQGCPSEPSENDLGTIPAESFSVLGTVQTGTTGSTPEPTSLVLFGSGVMAAIGVLRRKFS
jgi:hypothetical protein